MLIDFKFALPTKIFFGDNCVKKNYNHLLLGRHALIVTGKKSSKYNGSLNDVTNILNEHNVGYTIFDEVNENPDFQCIEEGKKLGIKNNIDFIISIGGGSPLDGGKAISLFIKNPTLNSNNLMETTNLIYLPIVAIPTTSGTGSEITQYSIITDNTKETKINIGHTIYPTVSFLDPQYTYNLPNNITISTSLDTLCHLIEGYLNTKANIFSDNSVYSGLTVYSNLFNNLIENNFTYDFRNNIMYTSMLGGLVISQTGTSIPHALSYPLIYYKNIPHGTACAIVLIEYLKTFKNTEKLNSMLSILKLKDLQELEYILNKLVCSDISLNLAEIEKYSQLCYENKLKLKNHTEEIHLNDIINIYE